MEKTTRQRKMVLIYSYKKADYRAGPFFNSKKGTKNFKNSSIYYFKISYGEIYIPLY